MPTTLYTANGGGTTASLPPDTYHLYILHASGASSPYPGGNCHSTIVFTVGCLSVVPSWDCNPTTGQCSDPGTGLGAWPTQADCYANCWAASWDCVNGTCIDPQTGLGQYATETDCQTNCGIPSWNCSGQWGVSLTSGISIPSWTCYDPGSGLGTYSTLAACIGDCNAPQIPPTQYFSIEPPSECCTMQGHLYNAPKDNNTCNIGTVTNAMYCATTLGAPWQPGCTNCCGNYQSPSNTPSVSGTQLTFYGKADTCSSGAISAIWSEITNLSPGSVYTLSMDVISIPSSGYLWLGSLSNSWTDPIDGSTKYNLGGISYTPHDTSSSPLSITTTGVKSITFTAQQQSEVLLLGYFAWSQDNVIINNISVV